ncbi:hypothetical protein [Motilibacter rhizosphaerae]|uniref:hypothetical protein n=1 Tax=Motilibacter rhizosphaerae TaxID=598652 RepID=UPI00102AF9B2|nr:hypothetical protein [Motilibacter rhizosphaerae]
MELLDGTPAGSPAGPVVESLDPEPAEVRERPAREGAPRGRRVRTAAAVVLAFAAGLGTAAYGASSAHSSAERRDRLGVLDLGVLEVRADLGNSPRDATLTATLHNRGPLPVQLESVAVVPAGAAAIPLTSSAEERVDPDAGWTGNGRVTRGCTGQGTPLYGRPTSVDPTADSWATATLHVQARTPDGALHELVLKPWHDFAVTGLEPLLQPLTCDVDEFSQAYINEFGSGVSTPEGPRSQKMVLRLQGGTDGGSRVTVTKLEPAQPWLEVRVLRGLPATLGSNPDGEPVTVVLSIPSCKGAQLSGTSLQTEPLQLFGRLGDGPVSGPAPLGGDGGVTMAYLQLLARACPGALAR